MFPRSWRRHLARDGGEMTLYFFAYPRLEIDDMTKEGDSYGDTYGSEI